MRSIGLTAHQQVEIIGAYAAPMKQVNAAVAASALWTPAGAFFLPATFGVSLEALGVVSDAGVTLNARIFDSAAGAAVDGTQVSITSTTDARAVSNPVSLIGQKLYRIEMQVIGPSGSGLLYTASLV